MSSGKMEHVSNKPKLRRGGYSSRSLRALMHRQQVEDRMEVEEETILLREPKLGDKKKKKKKRASLLRASEQCSAVLTALRHIMEDFREDLTDDSMSGDRDTEMVDSLEIDNRMDTSEDFDGVFTFDHDTADSGRYVIPSKPQKPFNDNALPVPVVRRRTERGKKKRRKRKRYLESEKAQKYNSLPLGFKIDASKVWEVDSMTEQMESMKIKNRRSHKRSPSQGSPETQKKNSAPSLHDEAPPSKRKALSSSSDKHKPPIDLPLLHLSDIPRVSCKIYSPDLSKSCNIISPRSAFSRSPRNTSPLSMRCHSPVNPAHQRPPSPRTRSPLGSPSWTPRSSARMANTLLRSMSPTTHQNTN